MAREMSPGLSEIYTKFAAQQEENRIRGLEEARRRNRVKELFKQGVNTLETFGIAREGFRGRGTEPGISGIQVYTPSVALEIEGNEVSFTMRGFKRNYLSPKSQSPSSYEYISVNRIKEGDRNFEVDNAWLFHIQAGNIGTPFSKVNNDPEVIEAASSLFDVIQQSLSETHTPRTQEYITQPRIRGYFSIFRSHSKPT